MALFSKKEEERNNGAPRAPPLPPMPPAPGQNANSIGSSEISKPSIETHNLSAPPIPGGNLDDIKAQVTGNNKNLTKQDSIREQPISQEELENEPTIDNEEEDSLFDFSELELQSPINADIPKTNEQEETQNDDSDNLALGFINNDTRRGIKGDSCFVTTQQFKSLLEIVENVKNKVKDASNTHLKLLDIKSEEDIEFENLRKDFQFIEDKLYELDNIIFEK